MGAADAFELLVSPISAIARFPTIDPEVVLPEDFFLRNLVVVNGA